MAGPLIYGFSEDAVAAAKVIADFAKGNDKLVIKAGAYARQGPGRQWREGPGRDPEQGSAAVPAAGLLQSPVSRIARVLAALAEKRGGGAEAPAPQQPAACRLTRFNATYHKFRKPNGIR